MKKARGVFENVPGSGVWWIQYFDAEGKRRREKVGSKRTAIKVVELRRTQRLEGRKLPKPRTRPLLFSELTDAAIEYTKGKAGHKAAVSRMKNLLAKFRNQAAEAIQPDEIETWLEERTDWTIATRNRHLALLKLVFRLAEKKGRIARNPVRLVRQKKENNARIRFLTASAESALRSVLNDPAHVFAFEIGLHTGVRCSEQYGMLWQDVDIDNGIITVPVSKSGELRHVRMNSRVKAILATMKAQSIGSGRVFEEQSPRYWFEAAVKAAGIRDFTWHCLRHTFISRLVMAGVDLRTVQELVGHKNISMTCRYAHLAPSHEQAAVEKLVQEPPSATSTATEEFREKNAEPVSVQ